MKSELNINKTLFRPMTIADYDEVRALWEATDGVALHEPSDCRSQIEFYLQRNAGLSLVVEHDSRIIAAVLCGHDGRRGYLSHLAVAGNCRGCGIGTELVNQSLTRLVAAGVPGCNVRLMSYNDDGRRFWTRLNWRKLDVEVFISPDETVS